MKFGIKKFEIKKFWNLIEIKKVLKLKKV